MAREAKTTALEPRDPTSEDLELQEAWSKIDDDAHALVAEIEAVLARDKLDRKTKAARENKNDGGGLRYPVGDAKLQARALDILARYLDWGIPPSMEIIDVMARLLGTVRPDGSDKRYPGKPGEWDKAIAAAALYDTFDGIKKEPVAKAAGIFRSLLDRWMKSEKTGPLFRRHWQRAHDARIWRERRAAAKTGPVSAPAKAKRPAASKRAASPGMLAAVKAAVAKPKRRKTT